MGTGQILQWQIATTSSSSSEISSPSKSSSSSTSSFPLEDEILAGLTDSRAAVQEAALLLLRAATREGGADVRASLCNPALLAALRSFLLSLNRPSLQSNAAASVVNLSLHPPNRVNIVRAGTVPPLIHLLRAGPDDARDHAAAAMFSLTVEDGNRVAIAALGALPPLLRLMAQTSAPVRVRRDAAMAVHHLSKAGANQSKIVKLGTVKLFLQLLEDEEEEKEGPRLSSIALITLCNLAARGEGRAAMLDAGAVAAVVRMMRLAGLSEEKREWCVAALYLMSKGSMRFRVLAKEEAAEEVLAAAVEKGKTWRTRELARRALRAVVGKADKDCSMFF